MVRLAIALVIFASSPAIAAPRIAGGLDYTVARGNTIEHLDLGLRLETGLFFHYGPWQATASFAANLKIESTLPARDGESLGGYGLGGRLAYHHRIGRGVLEGAIGFERLWLEGAEPVRRGCRETGACLLGYFTEVPDYDAWAPQLRIGFGPHLDHPTMMLGLTFELIVEPVYFADVPPDGLAGVAVYAAATATIGGGSRD